MNDWDIFGQGQGQGIKVSRKVKNPGRGALITGFYPLKVKLLSKDGKLG